MWKYLKINKLDKSIWVSPKKIKKDKQEKCKYCDMETSSTNIKRWHNEKCKHKTTNYIDPRTIRKTSRKIIKVNINGISYRSINAASKELNLSKYEIKRLSKEVSMKIKSIERVGKQKVYDLSIDSENYDEQHYVLENGVVSHNTGR